MIFSLLAVWVREEKKIGEKKGTHKTHRMVGGTGVEGGSLYSWVPAQALLL